MRSPPGLWRIQKGSPPPGENGKEIDFMAFTRKAVAAFGLTKEQVDRVMALYYTNLPDDVPRSQKKQEIGKKNESQEE